MNRTLVGHVSVNTPNSGSDCGTNPLSRRSHQRVPERDAISSSSPNLLSRFRPWKPGPIFTARACESYRISSVEHARSTSPTSSPIPSLSTRTTPLAGLACRTSGTG
eukprot:scaffold23495_cov112-Isochrysis_galbana.AAC.5